MHPYPRVGIVGAGAIGGWLGARLAAAGAQVSLLARAATLAAVRQHGLRLRSGLLPNQELLTQTVSASDDVLALGVQDLVVLSVKAPALAGVAAQVRALVGPETLVLSAMNGVPWWFFQGFGGALAGTRLRTIDPDGRIAAAIPAGQVIGGVVHASCSVLEPGLIAHHFGNHLIIGEPAGGVSHRLQALADLLRRAGLDVTVSEKIQQDVWYKLWGNMTVNPVSALTGASTDRILADPLVRDFISRVMLEARAIGARIGIPITQQPEERHAVTRQLGAFKTSMLQDLQAGRPLELDALLGAVCELAGLVGLETPFADALFGLSRLQARGLGLY